MPTLDTSFTRDWLSSRRDELNGRFRLAKRRSSSLDAESVLALCAELLPPLGGDGEDGAAELLSAAWDLILLHAGRGTLSPRGGSNPAIATLFRETLPKLRPLLLARPRFLPGALSNAVENLGRRGEEFARKIVGVAGHLERGMDLPEAGALLAWRLGEARLRTEALKAAERLPVAATLQALGLDGWPSEAAALAIPALHADAWRRPEDAIEATTLAKLPKAAPRRLEDLRHELSAPPRAPLAEWEAVGSIGDFSGFDGHFDEPPLLLAAPDTSRHRFWAIAANGAFRIDADIYGWSCRPDAAAADFKVGEPKTRGFIASLLGTGDDGAPRLAPDGTLTSGGGSARFEDMAGATSFVAREDFVAWTVADSHRIRMRVARGAAV
ncbi:MAG: hypothetical protein AAB074_14025 [Planctomycetota bacterium]